MGVYANSALAPDLWCVCARGAGGGQGGAAAKAGVGARTHAHTPAINRARAHTVSQTPDFTPPPSRRLARRDSRRRFWPTRPAGSVPSPRRASTTSSRPPPPPPEPAALAAGTVGGAAAGRGLEADICVDRRPRRRRMTPRRRRRRRRTMPWLRARPCRALRCVVPSRPHRQPHSAELTHTQHNTTAEAGGGSAV